MSFRGVHFALTDAELAQLQALPTDELADHIGNVVEEEKVGSADACETDKSWAYIHAALTGSDPHGDLGIPSFSDAPAPRASFLGRLFGRPAVANNPPRDEVLAVMGRQAMLASDDYFVGLVASSHVPAVASALEAISTEALGARVIEVHRRFDASGEAEEAAEYAMGWYPGLVLFYRRAADAQKHVIFTVDF